MTKWAVTPESHTKHAPRVVCLELLVGVGGAFLHFWALECSSPINTPTFSFSKLVATCHQKKKKKKLWESLLSFSSISNHNRAISYRGGGGGCGGVESPKSHTLKNETGLLFTGDSLINTFVGS